MRNRPFARSRVSQAAPIADSIRAPLTSWPSLQTDIRNAGGQWQDQEVLKDGEGGYPLVTSRKPDDLDAFGKAIVELFS